GDDIARTRSELVASATLPWAASAIAKAFQDAHESGRVVCVEMLDEATLCWGETPRPADGRWQRGSPIVGDDAIDRVLRAIHGVHPPPICWPVHALAGPRAVASWMGDPGVSDYATVYWTLLDWRAAYPWSVSLPQVLDSLEQRHRQMRQCLPVG